MSFSSGNWNIPFFQTNDVIFQEAVKKQIPGQPIFGQGKILEWNTIISVCQYRYSKLQEPGAGVACGKLKEAGDHVFIPASGFPWA